MKKLILLGLIFCSFSAFSQSGITFKVEELSKPTKKLNLVTIDDIYKRLILSDLNISKSQLKKDGADFDYDILAKSKTPDKLVNFGATSFFSGMHNAYRDHRPFVLSPDMIWLLISQGFAQHVNANSEKMRDYFVDFSGKMSLVIESKKPSTDPSIPWEKIVSDFTEQIEKNVGKDFVKLMTCDFSTTTFIEKTVSQITIMETVKSFFEFIVIYAGCGIPEISLQGTPDDWQKVLDKAVQLKKYDLDWWISELEPLLKEFVKASKGEIDTDFWKTMFKYHSQEKYNAPNIIDGWIIKFYPYDKKGKKNNLQELVGNDNLPDEIVKVDITYFDMYNDTIIETPLEIWAGFVGLEQNDESFALTPKMGWMIRKKTINNVNLKNKLEKAAEGSGISIRVKEIPPVLFELERIETLKIKFIDSINIPDELKKVNIKWLILEGEITDEGIERIKKMFPESFIQINYKNILNVE